MCLAIPGKVTELKNEDGLLMGKIDFAGSISKVCLSYCSDVKVGQYVIVHAGFAISILDEKEAIIALNLYNEMAKEISKHEKKYSQ